MTHGTPEGGEPVGAEAGQSRDPDGGLDAHTPNAVSTPR